jgi:hypothetical protein
VPKFTIYSENENSWVLNGNKGMTISMLPPITLYKEFFNILVKESADSIMSEEFINDHK